MAGVNRTQIEYEMAQALPGRHKDAKIAMAVLVECIQRTLISGERVHITGLGSFTATQVEARMVHNPATGEKVRAEKTARVVFRPSDSLKDLIVGRKKLKAAKPVKKTK